MTTCRSCPAEVVFVKSEKTGRSMILDAKPGKGVIVMAFHEFSPGDDGGATLVDGYLIDPGEGGENEGAIVVDVYTDHHVTCPGSSAWKGKTRADPPSQLPLVETP